VEKKPLNGLSPIFFLVKDIHDIIKQAKFGDDRLRGLAVVAGQISAFSIDFAGRPYNTLTLPCERVLRQTAQVHCRSLQAFNSQVGIGSSHDCLSGICWICLSTSSSETGSNADRRTPLSVLWRNAGSGAHCVARRTFCTLSMKNDAQSVARSDVLIGDLSARLMTESIVCHRRLASLLLHFASCDRQKCLRFCSLRR